MKQVFGYLNPLSYVRRDSIRQNQENLLYHIINLELYQGESGFDRDINEQEPYDDQDLKLDDLEEVYLTHYDLLKGFSERESNFVEYIVESDDTLQGIALRFNINPKKVLEINSISEEMIVSGIKLRLPANQNIALQVIDSPPSNKSYLGRNLMDEIMLNGTTKKYNVAYLTEAGNFTGTLSINEDIILFDPSVTNQNISRLQACIAVKDIKVVVPIVLPTRMSEIGQQSLRDYIIQIILIRLGRRRKSLNQSIPSASIYFRLSESLENPNETTMVNTLQEICSTITQLVITKQEQTDLLEEEEKQLLLLDEDLTLVPFFDLTESENVSMLITRANKVWGGSSYMPKMLDDSRSQSRPYIHEIVSHIPSVFKTGNWKLIYQNQTHGSSLTTLLKASEHHSPIILVIKEIGGHVFGAYLSDYLHLVLNQFFGSGETFLYTFKDLQIHTFHWTQVNSDFIFCDSHGIGVGCGDKFGLFINGDLTQGYSCRCDTFENDILSFHQDFQIDILELWALDLY